LSLQALAWSTSKRGNRLITAAPISHLSMGQHMGTLVATRFYFTFYWVAHESCSWPHLEWRTSF